MIMAPEVFNLLHQCGLAVAGHTPGRRIKLVWTIARPAPKPMKPRDKEEQ
jgi:hypothetical protein